MKSLLSTSWVSLYSVRGHGHTLGPQTRIRLACRPQQYPARPSLAQSSKSLPVPPSACTGFFAGELGSVKSELFCSIGAVGSVSSHVTQGLYCCFLVSVCRVPFLVIVHTGRPYKDTSITHSRSCVDLLYLQMASKNRSCSSPITTMHTLS